MRLPMPGCSSGRGVADYLQWLSGVDEEAAKDGDTTGADVEQDTLQPHLP